MHMLHQGKDCSVDRVYMKLDTDTKQRIKASGLFGIEFYRVLMGAFLTVFVPRTCDDHTCSLVENVTDTETLHLAALACNAATFLFFMALYFVEIRRENWCIKNLDIDDEKPADNLDDEIEGYPKLKQEMASLNKTYSRLGQCCGALQIANVGVSVTDISSHWAGAATLTPLVSYVLLVAIKLATVLSIAAASIKDERAYSAFLTGPKTYNTIDEDVREAKLVKKPGETDMIDVTARV